MALTIRPIALAEVRAFRRLFTRVFGGDIDEDNDGDERLTAILPVERTCAGFDGDTMVATSGTFDLRMSIPGGALPVAGLTMVTVAPTHRRRGLLRAMIAAHLDAAAARGDALSALWASESPIYGRFGYGIASESDAVTIDGAHALRIDERLGGDEVAPLLGDEVEAVVPPLYAETCAQRAGMLDRSAAWWTQRHFHDPPPRRQGASQRRYVVARRDGVARGYVCYRQRPKWDAGLPKGQTEIVELIAADVRAEVSLTQFARGIDLHPTLMWWNAPVDAALPWIVDDYRRVVRRRADGLWLRVCDVVKALTARAYAADGELILSVADPLRRDVEGTYALRVDGGAATCARTEAEPGLRLDTAALGSLYFGGVSAAHLARVGRLSASSTALAAIDRMFATPRAPWCPEIF